MRRFRSFLDFDKEERWLNEMAGAGWLLQKRGIGYRFSAIEPGSVVVRVDYRDRVLSRADFDNYVVLFADSGWQHLDGSRWGGSQYFAATGADPDADIFSDAESRAERYRRSLLARSGTAIPFLVLGFILLNSGDYRAWPQQWYLTPGLWDMHGAQFVGHFLFETPFALARGLSPWIVLAVGILLVVQFGIQYRCYRRARLVAV
ncbi:MAG TPA: DUF2812 domain-containing protein [Propionicimonas sp.]|nr:DUF2812 domain-containing protein [Propionicimonas sp.]